MEVLLRFYSGFLVVGITATLSMYLVFIGDLGARVLAARIYGFRATTKQHRFNRYISAFRESSEALLTSAAAATVLVLVGPEPLAILERSLPSPELWILTLATGVSGALVAMPVHGLSLIVRRLWSRKADPAMSIAQREHSQSRSSCECESGLRRQVCAEAPRGSQADKDHRHRTFALGLGALRPGLQWFAAFWGGFLGGLIALFAMEAVLLEPLVLSVLTLFLVVTTVVLPAFWVERGIGERPLT